MSTEERDAYFTMDESERQEIKGKDDVFVFRIMLLKVLYAVSFLKLQIFVTNFPATKEQLCLIRITSVPQLLSLQVSTGFLPAQKIKEKIRSTSKRSRCFPAKKRENSQQTD